MNIFWVTFAKEVFHNAVKDQPTEKISKSPIRYLRAILTSSATICTIHGIEGTRSSSDCTRRNSLPFRGGVCECGACSHCQHEVDKLHIWEEELEGR